MSNLQPVVVRHETEPGSVGMYVSGFVTSVALTLGAYLLVAHRVWNGNVLITAIIALALVQFAIQLVFFLHLNHNAKPRWKQLVFWFMILVVSILVIGSIWIMNNLNYHMSLQQQQQYLKSQDSL